MTAEQLAERLLRRFKSVPGYTEDDALDATLDAMAEQGLEPSDDVPADKINIVLLIAQKESAWSIAFSVAHYFKYTDGEESVDKSMLADNYRKLALDLQAECDKELGKVSSGFARMPRPDRP